MHFVIISLSTIRLKRNLQSKTGIQYPCLPFFKVFNANYLPITVKHWDGLQDMSDPSYLPPQFVSDSPDNNNQDTNRER